MARRSRSKDPGINPRGNFANIVNQGELFLEPDGSEFANELIRDIEIVTRRSIVCNVLKKTLKRTVMSRLTTSRMSIQSFGKIVTHVVLTALQTCYLIFLINDINTLQTILLRNFKSAILKKGVPGTRWFRRTWSSYIANYTPSDIWSLE
ncbi:unnamed protein product [Trichogramma brassicae]|uniref:Uncharacterized protein n=1 Tax=Trichogramma brassicae TaxID=86971 RepID=A0A6H5ITZ1_9HYME|nr:unnamed protein product [Trichogramma brassicae]